MLMTARLPTRLQDLAALYPYRWIVAVVSAVTGLLWLTQHHVNDDSIPLFYLLAVLICAVSAKRLPVVVGALTCFLAFKFFFVEPIFTLTVNDIARPWELLSFIIAALIAGAMTLRVREQARQIATLTATNQHSSTLQPAELTYYADGEFTFFLDDRPAEQLVTLFEQGRLVVQQNPAWELHDALSEFVRYWLDVRWNAVKRGQQ